MKVTVITYRTRSAGTPICLSHLSKAVNKSPLNKSPPIVPLGSADEERQVSGEFVNGAFSHWLGKPRDGPDSQTDISVDDR